MPLLIVNIDPKYFINKLTTNDPLYININLEGGTSDEILAYSSSIIYKFETVGVKTFDFTKFRLNPNELYDNYTNFDTIILIKVTAYNPKFSVPS